MLLHKTQVSDLIYHAVFNNKLAIYGYSINDCTKRNSRQLKKKSNDSMENIFRVFARIHNYPTNINALTNSET